MKKLNTEMYANDDTMGLAYIIFLLLFVFVVIWSNIDGSDDFRKAERDIKVERVIREEPNELYLGSNSDAYRNWGVRNVCIRGSRDSLRADTISPEAYSMDSRTLEAGVETYDTEGQFVQSTSDTAEQIQEEIEEGECEMLAQLIEAEAGNQDFKGKCLVADVVLNRVKSKTFPDTIEGVIFQYLTESGRKYYQFSTVVDGNYEKAGWYISEDSFKAAYQEYYTDKRVDSNVLYFTAGEYNPYCSPLYKYGDHYFGN